MHGDQDQTVYFKSQNPYTYTEAIQYCNRQEIDEKSTGVGIHPSQLWKFNQTTGQTTGYLIVKWVK